MVLLKAFNGTVSNKLTGNEGNYEVKDTYQSSGVCESDGDYCKNDYVIDEAKGTGILIQAALLAEETAAKLENKKFQPYYDFQLNETSVTAVKDATVTVKALYKKNGLTVDTNPSGIQWTSSNDNIATVSNGVITGVANGSATISATLTVDGTTHTASVALSVVMDNSAWTHIFEVGQKTSSFYTISGDNLATGKGSATVDGTEYSTCLKMNGNGKITFTAPNKGEVTLIFNTGSAGKTIDINGTVYPIPSDGVLTADVSAGNVTIVRKSGESFLFAVKYVPGSTSGGTTEGGTTGATTYSYTIAFDSNANTSVEVKKGESTTLATPNVTITATQGEVATAAEAVYDYNVAWTASNDSTGSANVSGNRTDGYAVTGVTEGNVTLTATIDNFTVDGTAATATLSGDAATVDVTVIEADTGDEITPVVGNQYKLAKEFNANKEYLIVYNPGADDDGKV